MALGDIQVYSEGAFGYPGDDVYVVNSGAAASIKAGEPVSKALGAANVTAMATNKPVVATDFLAGVAASTSTDTASANGIVYVTKLVPGLTFLISPNSATA